MPVRNRMAFGAALAVASLVAAGCLGGGGGGGGGGAGAGGATVKTAGKANDKKIEIFGAFSGAEGDLFRKSLADFQQKSGISINYASSTDFTTLIRSRVQGNNAPDIALFPQPGLLKDIANSGKLAPLDSVLDMAKLNSTLIPGLLAKGNDGKVYGAPMRMAVKSLVWYPVPAFEKAGYTPPTTENGLIALTDKIRSQGKTPWCIGMEAGQATGWVATDWIEEYVLRFGGPDQYDQWVQHKIPFNSDLVKKAANEFAKIAFTPGNVLGGRKAIVSTPFGDSPNPMFKNPPGCYLHRQGNFITGFFPKNIQANLAANVNLFVLPPVEGGYSGQPILGGGDLATLFNPQDNDAVEVLKFITSDQFGGPWAKAGGWLSPHKTFDAAQYPDAITRKIAEIASKATVFRFDGSDDMPGQVGSGTFWTQMVAWVSGQKSLDAALQAIDASWPKS